ncbi:MAG: hypothetical protein LBN27_13440 [Prevotellaceae bacterium]|jgi:hypothetical protein|nr:hypothetical protein [Prevotellaceae bacterium]
MRKTLFVILTAFLTCACSQYSKTAYLKNFESFVADVEQNYQQFTEQDWQKKDAEFEEYSEKYYKKHKRDLTDAEKKKIGKLHARYLIAKSKGLGGNFLDDVKDGINYINGFFDELTEDNEN